MRIGKYLSLFTKLHFYTHRDLVFSSMVTINTNDFPKQIYPVGITNGGELFSEE